MEKLKRNFKLLNKFNYSIPLLTLACLGVLTCLTVQRNNLYFNTLDQNPLISSFDQGIAPTIKKAKTMTIAVTGDVIPARSVNYQSAIRNNFDWPYTKFIDYFDKADTVIINLESPLIKNCPITQEGMVFCGDARHVQGLAKMNVTVANIANNHMGNYGPEGISETINLLKLWNIITSGTDSISYLYVNGVRLAFLGYNDIGATIFPLQSAEPELIRMQVQEASKSADIVIVSFHWGNEYSHQPNERQILLARTAVDSGADLIIGNHPHWVQPAEYYNGKLIVYAHGNFIFDQMWSEKTRQGVIGWYTFSNQKLINFRFDPIWIEDYGQPRLSDDNNIVEMMENDVKAQSVLDK